MHLGERRKILNYATIPKNHLLGCAGLVLLASPSAFLTRRMADQIRGIGLVVVPEDRYLQGYTGV